MRVRQGLHSRGELRGETRSITRKPASESLDDIQLNLRVPSVARIHGRQRGAPDFPEVHPTGITSLVPLGGPGCSARVALPFAFPQAGF